MVATVRRLESENSRLQLAIQTQNESSTRNAEEIKKLFETELDDARQLVQELAHEKASLTIDAAKYKAESEEASAKLSKQTRDKEEQVAKLKKQLEDETLARTDLANKNQTLKEDLAFKAIFSSCAPRSSRSPIVCTTSTTRAWSCHVSARRPSQTSYLLASYLLI
jgi:hypothetical protein